jgi:hypothetical protein
MCFAVVKQRYTPDIPYPILLHITYRKHIAGSIEY